MNARHGGSGQRAEHGLGNLNVLDCHASEVRNRDLFVGGATFRPARNDVANLDDLFVPDEACPTGLGDLPARPALQQAVGDHDIGLGKNVRVNCLCPGLTETEMAHTLGDDAMAHIIENTPIGRIGQPEELASVARFLLSEESSYMTGQTIVASGGRCMLPG